MAEKTIITWNATNWITVIIMAVVGFFIIGLVAGGVRRMRGQSSEGE